MAPRFTQAAIVGVGLIGGSLGMVLKRQALAGSIVGIGRRVENLKTAVELGALDRFVVDAKECIRDSDLVILATPVDTYERQLKDWATVLRPGTIVSDVGSVKGALVGRVEDLMPGGVHFVGAHPIAGKEKTGVAAGSPELFRGARCIVTPTQRSNSPAVQAIRELWETAGATVISMDPFVHDRVMGAVSHLPHVAAFSLITALGEIQEQMVSDVDLMSYGGGGLRDTTRIAASSSEMWRDICLWNRDNLITMVEAYERHLAHFKRLIETSDGPGLEKAMGRAKEIREKVR